MLNIVIVLLYHSITLDHKFLDSNRGGVWVGLKIGKKSFSIITTTLKWKTEEKKERKKYFLLLDLFWWFCAHLLYDQIGFVLDLRLKFLLRSCENLAAVVRYKHFCQI